MTDNFSVSFLGQKEKHDQAITASRSSLSHVVWQLGITFVQLVPGANANPATVTIYKRKYFT